MPKVRTVLLLSLSTAALCVHAMGVEGWINKGAECRAIRKDSLRKQVQERELLLSAGRGWKQGTGRPQCGQTQRAYECTIPDTHTHTHIIVLLGLSFPEV